MRQNAAAHTSRGCLFLEKRNILTKKDGIAEKKRGVAGVCAASSQQVRGYPGGVKVGLMQCACFGCPKK
jgi:hypothetical protein